MRDASYERCDDECTCRTFLAVRILFHNKLFQNKQSTARYARRVRKMGRSGEHVEYARIASRIGDALMTALGLGHHEFAVHFGDIRVKTGIDGNAM